MSEAQGEEITTESSAINMATVLPFARRTLRTEPYLTDDERAALRRLIALLPRLEEVERQMGLLATACPTARRELSGR